MLSRCFLDFSVGVRAFVIGLSQISSFFTYYQFLPNLKKVYPPTWKSVPVLIALLCDSTTSNFILSCVLQIYLFCKFVEHIVKKDKNISESLECITKQLSCYILCKRHIYNSRFTGNFRNKNCNVHVFINRRVVNQSLPTSSRRSLRWVGKLKHSYKGTFSDKTTALMVRVTQTDK